MNYRSDDGSVKTGAKRVSVNVQKKNKKKQDLNVSGYKRLKTYEDNVQPGFICNKIETANLYPSKYKMDRAKGQKMKVVSKIVENHNSMISEEGFSDNMSDSSLFYELSNISQDHNIEFQFNKQKHPTMRRIDSNAWDSSEEPFSSTVLFYPKDSDLINLSKENDYFSTNKFQQQTSTYYFNKHISNPCNKSSSAFYNTKFRNPRFEPASEMLKANCLDSASRFTENLLDKNAGLKGREFKQIYRANRAQISRTLQFDITLYVTLLVLFDIFRKITVFEAVSSPVNLKESWSLKFFTKKIYVKNDTLVLTVNYIFLFFVFPL